MYTCDDILDGLHGYQRNASCSSETVTNMDRPIQRTNMRSKLEQQTKVMDYQVVSILMIEILMD